MANKRNRIKYVGSLLAVAITAVIVLVAFLLSLPVKVEFYENNKIVKSETVWRSSVLSNKQVPSISKEGYTFAGWYEDPSFIREANLKQTIKKDVKFYAKFLPKRLSARIFANDGTNNYYDIQGEFNYLIKLYDETNPDHNVLTNSAKHAEYTLVGFKTSLSSTRIYLLDEQIAMRGNTIYYAVWQGLPQQISFNTENATVGGGNFTKEDTTVNQGEYYTVNLNDFAGVVHETTQLGVRGLTVVGGDGTIYRHGERIKIDGPITLQLVFMETNSSIVINYNNGQPNRIITPGETFTFDEPETKQFHRCIGYYTSNLTYEQMEASGILPLLIGSEIVNAESGTHYFAIWEPLAVQIIFDSNTEEEVVGRTDNIDTRFGKTVYLVPNGYSMQNYKFLGWAFENNATVPDFINGEIVTIDENIMQNVSGGVLKLYAVWEALYTKIIYHRNDGTNTTTSVEKLINNPTYLESALTRDNYTFQYWADSLEEDATHYSAGAYFEVGSATVNLYAIWLGDTKYVRIVDLDLANNFVPEEPFSIIYGEQFEVDILKYADVTAKANGAYVKGLTIDGGDGTIYLNGSRITILSDVNLVLCFLTENESVVIDFNNGDAKELFAPDSVIDFSIYSPTKEKNSLLGYCTTNISYKEIASYTLISKTGSVDSVPAGIVYYAIWEPELVYVIFDANNSDVIGTLGRVTGRVGENVVIWSENYSAIGWKFIGWSKNKNASIADYIAGNTMRVEISEIVINELDENTITLYAIWEIVYVEITFNYNGGSGALTTKQFQAGKVTYIDDDNFFEATFTNYAVVGWSYDPSEKNPDKIFSKDNRWFYADPELKYVYMIWEPANMLVSFNTSGAWRNGATFNVSSTFVRYGSTYTIDFSQFVNVRRSTTSGGDNLIMKGLAISGGDGTIYTSNNNVITVLKTTTFNIVYYQDYESVVVEYQRPYVYNSTLRRDIYLADDDFTLLDRTHMFYSLTGYSLSQVGEVQYFIDSTYNLPAGTILYGQWDAKLVNVVLETFNAENGTHSVGTEQVYAGDMFAGPDINFDTFGIELRFEWWTFNYERYTTPSARYYPYSPIELDVYTLDKKGYLENGVPTIKLYAVFNDEAAIFHFISSQEGAEYWETISIYVGQETPVPMVFPAYDKLTFLEWWVSNQSVGYINGNMLYAENQGETYVYAQWQIDDVVISYVNNETGATIIRTYAPNTQIELPTHHEFYPEEVDGWEYWYDWESQGFGNKSLGIYAWQDGTTGTIFQAGPMMEPHENFNVGWNDITLTAEWATPMEYFNFYYWDWPGPSVSWQGPHDYDHDVIIPKIFYGREVEVITGSGFANFDMMRKIILPNTIRVIREHAFYNCKNLEEVLYDGAQINEIHEYAFYGCSSLISFNGGHNVNDIREWAFAGCSSLREVFLGGGVNTIQQGVFANCNSLTNINFAPSYIGALAFANCYELQYIDLSQAYYIDLGAFTNCKMLNGPLYLNNVNMIGAMAFSGCENLRDVYLPGWQLWEVGINAFAGTNANIYIRDIGAERDLPEGWRPGWYDASCNISWG